MAESMTYKMFTLHDGQSEKLTVELHAFMEGIEWEGGSAGITIWLEVRPGDVIVRGSDGSINVRPKEMETTT